MIAQNKIFNKMLVYVNIITKRGYYEKIYLFIFSINDYGANSG